MAGCEGGMVGVVTWHHKCPSGQRDGILGSTAFAAQLPEAAEAGVFGRQGSCIQLPLLLLGSLKLCTQL